VLHGISDATLSIRKYGALRATRNCTGAQSILRSMWIGIFLKPSRKNCWLLSATPAEMHSTDAEKFDPLLLTLVISLGDILKCIVQNAMRRMRFLNYDYLQ
jgi:hypothetical protein